MKRVVPAFVIAGLAVVGVYAYFRNEASDDDRQSVSKVVSSAKELIGEVSSRVKPIIDGMKHDNEVSMEENRQATKQQWSELGF